MALYMFFGLLWITSFIEYAGNFIIIASAASYYFDSNADEEGNANVMQGVKWAYINHFGSIAFGSFIIAVIKLIKFMFLYISQYLEEAIGEDSSVAFIFKCAACIVDCLERICDYINESAFCYMAVKGDSFCTSALSALLLQVKHIFEFMFAQWIATVFIWLGKAAITVGNIFSCIFIMQTITKVYDDLSSPFGPILLVGLVSYMTASVFLGLFDTAVLSMMTSMAVDMDLNNGNLKFGPPTFHDEDGKMNNMKKKAREENEKREKKKKNKM